MDRDAMRIGAAWKELRRGASMLELRQLMYGGRVGAEPLDVALGDALDAIIEHEPIRMGDLAEALRVDASTATRTVARLTAAGLAARVECADDRRVVQVKATPAGRRRQAAMVRSATQALDEIAGVFDEDERAQLAELMERLVSSLDAVVDRRRGTA
jgi:DNA-binding MarR family transcriptional regulator